MELSDSLHILQNEPGGKCLSFSANFGPVFCFSLHQFLILPCWISLFVLYCVFSKARCNKTKQKSQENQSTKSGLACLDCSEQEWENLPNYFFFSFDFTPLTFCFHSYVASGCTTGSFPPTPKEFHRRYTRDIMGGEECIPVYV